MRITLTRGGSFNRNKFLERLVENLYERNDIELKRGAFRVRGDTVDVMPAYLEHGLRVEFFGDEIEALTEFEPLTGAVLRKFEADTLTPAQRAAAPAAGGRRIGRRWSSPASIRTPIPARVARTGGSCAAMPGSPSRSPACSSRRWMARTAFAFSARTPETALAAR